MCAVHTNHEYYQLQLPDYATGRLEEQQRLELEAHLASCDECNRRRAEFSTLVALMQHSRPSDPPSHYFSNVLPRIRERLEQRSTRGESPLVSRILAPLGALAVVIGLLVQIPMDKDNDLRAMLGALKSDELADVVVEEAEHQSLYLIPSTESLAAALSDQAIDRELAAAILLDGDDATFESVTDLSDQDVNLILERLGERKIL